MQVGQSTKEETVFKLAKLNNEPEIFYTVQGEGLNLGQPSIFIRTALCNLYCSWCDTPYTWNWEGTPFKHADGVKFEKKDFLIELHPLAVARTVQQYPCKNLVFTGGEPMLQQKAWVALMELLPDYHFEVETNATVSITSEFEKLVHQYNCSPKLASSGNVQAQRETKAFVEYAQNPKATFKFVVCTNKDLQDVLALATRHGIIRERILVMPEGRTPKELNEKTLWLVEQAKKEGLRFTPRLHVDIWGAKRGV